MHSLLVSTPEQLWHILQDSCKSGPVYNFTATVMNMNNILVKSELFPEKVLEAYTAYNLGKNVPADDWELFSPKRGGIQGDYRTAIIPKIANVVSCLTEFPRSKRALITIPEAGLVHHSDDAAAKCLREIYFQLHETSEGKMLNCSVVMRAQAAEIFPKNVHFIGSLQHEIARRLNARVGSMHYYAAQLFSTRED